MTDFRGLLSALAAQEVRFIVIGGAAAIAHGSAALTLDLDILYERDSLNHKRLAAALAPFDPYLRGAPPGLPFRLDEATLSRGFNYTLITNLGSLDLLAEIPGGGSYQDLAPQALQLNIFGASCLCLTLPQLITAKRAAGRPKDLQAIAELEALEDNEQP